MAIYCSHILEHCRESEVECYLIMSVEATFCVVVCFSRIFVERMVYPF